MLVIVAVVAQVLPVAAIGWVVVVVAVPVMDGQEIDVGLIELAAAFGADLTVDLQRFRPVVGVAVRFAAQPLEDGCSLIGAGKGDGSGAS